MGSIRKQPLDANRLRAIPEEGFSWIDRRFLRHGFSHTLSSTEILLYWFLCSVADKHGLSYYSDPRISTILKLSPESSSPAIASSPRRSSQPELRPIREILKELL